MARALTPGETALARRVFGDAIQLEGVRIHRGGFGGFAVTVGRRLFLPAALSRLDFAKTDHRLQALFIHELVHVWQFQSRPFRTLGSWALTAAGGGYGPGMPGYRYSLPLKPFNRLNLEQQASVVEHRFLWDSGVRPAAAPVGARREDLGDEPFPLRPE